MNVVDRWLVQPLYSVTGNRKKAKAPPAAAVVELMRRDGEHKACTPTENRPAGARAGALTGGLAGGRDAARGTRRSCVPPQPRSGGRRPAPPCRRGHEGFLIGRSSFKCSMIRVTRISGTTSASKTQHCRTNLKTYIKREDYCASVHILKPNCSFVLFLNFYMFAPTPLSGLNVNGVKYKVKR